MELFQLGMLVKQSIQRIPDIYPGVCVMGSVIMPNHVHMLLEIKPEQPVSLFTVIRSTKAAVTKQWGAPVWQRSFHEHVIRSEREGLRFLKYMDENPLRWTLNEYYEQCFLRPHYECGPTGHALGRAGFVSPLRGKEMHMTFWEKVSQFGFEVLVFIVLAVIGFVLWSAMDSKKVKTWQKTAIMVVVTSTAVGLFIWLSWLNNSIPLCIFSAILGIGFLIGCIYGHRKGWK